MQKKKGGGRNLEWQPRVERRGWTWCTNEAVGFCSEQRAHKYLEEKRQSTRAKIQVSGGICDDGICWNCLLTFAFFLSKVRRRSAVENVGEGQGWMSDKRNKSQLFLQMSLETWMSQRNVTWPVEGVGDWWGWMIFFVSEIDHNSAHWVDEETERKKSGVTQLGNVRIKTCSKSEREDG